MQAFKKKKTWRPKLNAQSREGPGSHNDKLISDKQNQPGRAQINKVILSS